MVLEEGDGPSIMLDEPVGTEEDESVDVEQPAVQATAAAATVSPQRSSQPHAASTEDLTAKKKSASSRIPGSGLRAPTAGKGELIFTDAMTWWAIHCRKSYVRRFVGAPCINNLTYLRYDLFANMVASGNRIVHMPTILF